MKTKGQLYVKCYYFSNIIINSNEFDPLDINSIYSDELLFMDKSDSSGKILNILKTDDTYHIDKDYELTLTYGFFLNVNYLPYIGGYRSEDRNEKSVDVLMYYNNYYTFSPYKTLNYFSNNILKYYGVDEKNKIEVTLKLFPLYTIYKFKRNSNSDSDSDSNENENENLEEDMLDIWPDYIKLSVELYLVFAISVAMSISISLYEPLIVMEKEEGIHFQLLLNGTKYIIVPLTLIGTMVWTIAALLHQYATSHFFKKYNKASSMYNILNTIFSLLLGFLILKIYESGETNMIYLFFTIYRKEKRKDQNLRRNFDMESDERKKLDKKLKNGPKDVYNEWQKVKNSITNGNVNGQKSVTLKVYQIIQDYILNPTDIERIKKQYKRRLRNKKKNRNNIYYNYNYDEEDIEADINYENEDDKNSNIQMKTIKLLLKKMNSRIVYDKSRQSYLNRVVGDVTFGVDVGECLGLLGPNGAGKATAISIITGTIPHIYGTVIYGDKDLKDSSYGDLSLGYCSQFNSLWNHLTVKETVQFYLNICGYPKEDIHNYTKVLIKACGIEKHANKTVNHISGGTKRKLSLIVSICSSPSYLVLDEPSAGMDPFTRRYMWKIILGLKKIRKTATILTTHSTEEAEALCDRIAIMIKGRLVCIDTPRSIKMNHSNTYTLEVYTDKPEEFEKEYITDKNLFSLDDKKDYQLESYNTYKKYTVKMKIENIANVFSLMEEAKETGLISQYNFGQFSLEQVFINFINNTT
eukprot:jgi/Orpsp1_1/1180071/evm.model.c7180000072043.2